MKVGLFFGSFNPVHVGHMIIASYMLEFTDLDQVWFVVSPQNPFKAKSSLLPERQRLQMVKLAIGDNNSMKASDIEFGLPQPSYTINTLTYLKEKYPAMNFALIMGADNLQTFHKWKNYEEILSAHELYVYPRPGISAGDLVSYPQAKLINAPLMEISSTFIRNAVREKKDVTHYLPAAVHTYLSEMHFYEK